MKNILVSTDGSIAAQKALDVAVDLAKSHDAGLVLFHSMMFDKEPEHLLKLAGVFEDEELRRELEDLHNAPAVPHTLEEVMEHPDAPDHPVPKDVLQSIGEHVLDHALNAVTEHGVIARSLVVSDGDIAKGIVNAAEEVDAIIIVLGTRGLRQIDELTFGSVSHEVCRITDRTCVLVH